MRWLLVSGALWLWMSACLHSAEALYRREVKGTNRNAQFTITFEETRRDEKTSTAKTKMQGYAGSVGGSMILMRCWYDIAVEREAKYFIKLKEWKEKDGSHMYLMGFSQDRNVDPREYFGLKEPLPKSEEYQFMSVRQFAPFFKEMK